MVRLGKPRVVTLSPFWSSRLYITSDRVSFTGASDEGNGYRVQSLVGCMERVTWSCPGGPESCLDVCRWWSVTVILESRGRTG